MWESAHRSAAQQNIKYVSIDKEKPSARNFTRESTVSEERSATGKWQWGSEPVATREHCERDFLGHARPSLTWERLTSGHDWPLLTLKRLRSGHDWPSLTLKALDKAMIDHHWRWKGSDQATIDHHWPCLCLDQAMIDHHWPGKALWAKSGVRQGSDSEEANRSRPGSTVSETF
jgi:hypothetical protein